MNFTGCEEKSLFNAALLRYGFDDLYQHINGQQINYQEFYDTHAEYYASSKEYSVVYDEQTLSHETPKKLEVILIVEYKNNKMPHICELTCPDWSISLLFKKYFLRAYLQL